MNCRHIIPLALYLAVCSRLLASEAEYLSHEGPMPESVLEMQGAFEAVEKKPLSRTARLVDSLWNRASLTFNPRTYYLNKQRDTAPDSLAWALGGNLAYHSGLHRDRLSLGAVAYTSQKLHGPADKDGTNLLEPGQEGFTVLGEAHLNARLNDQIEALLYRQAFHLPYVNRNDTRMAPNTFEAYAVFNKQPTARLNWVAGHITKMKEQNSTSFRSMAEVAGADDADDGLSMAGVRYNFTRHMNLGAINYRAWNVMNIFYTEGNGAWQLGDDLALRLSGQYTQQKSSGDELAGAFDTAVYGIKLGISYRNAILSLAHTSTDDDSGIRSPFGGYPGYASVIIEDFDRAGEDAWLAGLSWNARRLGLEGLTVFANYVEGNTPDSGRSASPDQREFDITADYYFGGQTSKGLWLRLRGAFPDQEGPAAVDQQDFRIILNYSIALK